MTKRLPSVSLSEQIGQRIVALRGEKVLLDAELGRLFGVSTKRLNEQVARNKERFPQDFTFQLTDQEVRSLRSQFATSNKRTGRGGRRYRPYAFTELDDLERKTEALAHGHGAFAAATREQFKQVVAALRQLMAPTEPKRRPIGFVTQREKNKGG